MPTPTRVRHRLNSNLQWFDPPLDLSKYPVQLEADSLRLTDEGYVGVAPDLWGMHLSTTIERLWTSDVGQAVIECVRRRTTIYPTIGGAQCFPDRYEDNPLEAARLRNDNQAHAEAFTSGTTALVLIDLNRRGGAGQRSSDPESRGVAPPRAGACGEHHPRRLPRLAHVRRR